MFGEWAAEIMDKQLQKIDGEIRNDQQLHTRSDIEIKADAVGANGGAGSHQKFSLRGKTRGVKKGGIRVQGYKGISGDSTWAGSGVWVMSSLAEAGLLNLI